MGVDSPHPPPTSTLTFLICRLTKENSCCRVWGAPLEPRAACSGSGREITGLRTLFITGYLFNRELRLAYMLLVPS
jgi:hypothetical protein